MLTAEQLRKANESIRMTDVKGKAYAEVNQRIKAFRAVCPNGSIITEIVKDEGGVCLMKATVADESGNVLGVGHAYEKENSSYINKTSYIENCETSAVGRALGMCGIGVDTSLASAEEVQNAAAQQAKVGGRQAERLDAVPTQTGGKATNTQAEQLDTLKALQSDINKYSKALAEAEGRTPKAVYEEARTACPEGDLRAQCAYLLNRVRMANKS